MRRSKRARTVRLSQWLAEVADREDSVCSNSSSTSMPPNDCCRSEPAASTDTKASKRAKHPLSRRQSNREAAQRCRQRKLAATEALEGELLERLGEWAQLHWQACALERMLAQEVEAGLPRPLADAQPALPPPVGLRTQWSGSMPATSHIVPTSTLGPAAHSVEEQGMDAPLIMTPTANLKLLAEHATLVSLWRQ